MTEDRTLSVIVVGAGIAGLVAAYRLRKAGFAVTVLEKEQRVGGRFSTDQIDGFVIDRGAQFLSSAYTVVPQIVEELGLPELKPTSQQTVINRGGRLCRLGTHRPFSALTSRLLNPISFLRLGYQLAGLSRRSSCLPLSNYSDWHDFDDEDALSWSLRVFGQETTRHLHGALLNGFYYQSLQGNSKALLMAVMSFGYQRTSNVTLPGGLGAIAEALSKRVPVKLNNAVTSLHIDGDHTVVVTDENRYRADYVVLAAPASVALRLYTDADVLERSLMATSYSATINIAIATKVGYPLPRSLTNIYGILVSPANGEQIAAITIERNKLPDRAASGELLHVMLSNDAAKDYLAFPDDQILSRVMPELEQYFPGLSNSMAMARLYRWPEALPRSPVGRCTALHQYRQQGYQGKKVLLCGDYMGFPWSDSAAETGTWVAGRILAESSKQDCKLEPS